jgi:hypothetical protein
VYTNKPLKYQYLSQPCLHQTTPRTKLVSPRSPKQLERVPGVVEGSVAGAVYARGPERRGGAECGVSLAHEPAQDHVVAARAGLAAGVVRVRVRHRRHAALTRAGRRCTRGKHAQLVNTCPPSKIKDTTFPLFEGITTNLTNYRRAQC